MLTLIQISTAILTTLVMLTLASESFAYGLSRVVEAAFDYVEIKLAVRARRRVARPTSERDMEAIARSTRMEVSY